ncbi:UPF0261 family protein [Phytoactinopolyspora alkaliphila]|uniref:UPF0261 family protein n=1 Tax=Phytoactinopolyspora alkaliphila TaxID=1783498 RepID=A0A6N9YJV3_9ACTN|nr:Tm-1-like ATP-binding domain-containing protein [Phytoactinopolyspora alkaliphila]NED95215.1 UPF0261 family protein [Phytoactinopolyspora alkaliphila]
MTTVLLAGSLDTKGAEYEFLAAELHAHGVKTLTVDVGVRGEPVIRPDISRADVAKAAGVQLADLVSGRDRADALQVMADGLRVVVGERLAGIDGAVGMGGSGAVTLLAPAWCAMPFGFPRLLLTTMASTASEAVDGSDVLVMPSPVDISGLNSFTTGLLRRAAAVMLASVGAPVPEKSAVPLVAASMFGVTTVGVVAATRAVEAAGFDVITFHANGSGGRTMESLITQGVFAGVLDLTTTELADELLGGKASAGVNRLEAAGARGIPQVVSVGALDIANFGPPDTIPVPVRSRRAYRHGPVDTLVRTSVDDARTLGSTLAQKVCRSTGPVTMVLPVGGTSSLAEEGCEFWDPVAEEALVEALLAGLSEDVKVSRVDAALNTETFGRNAASELLKLMAR